MFQRKNDNGVDLFVGIDESESPPTRMFVVQVKGTVSANPSEWMHNVQQWFQARRQGPYLPTCVFVVNVRDNKAQYAWITEPVAEPDQALLLSHTTPEFHELTDATVSTIINQAKIYYDEMPKPQPAPV